MADGSRVLDIIINAQDNATKVIQGIGGSFTDLAKKAEVGATIVTGALTLAAKFGIDAATEINNAQRIMTTLLGDQAKSSKLMAEIGDFAKRTPFELSSVVNGGKQLLAYGFAAEGVVKNMEMLGNIAAGTNVPLGDMVYLYGTLKAQNRAYTKDLNQFTARGIPILGQLAKQFKTNEENIFKMAEQGKISFKDIEKAFQTMTGDGGQFKGLMDSLNGTVPQLLSNIKDQLFQSAAAFFGVSTNAEDFGKIIQGGLLDQLAQGLKVVLDYLNQLTPQIQGFMGAFLNNKTALYATIGGLTALMVPLAVATWGVLAPLIPFIAAGVALGAVVGLVVEKMGGWDNVTKTLADTWNMLVGVYNQYLKPVIDAIWANLTDFATTIAPTAQRAWDNVVTAIQVGAIIVKNIWDATWPSIADMFRAVWEIIKGVAKMAFGWVEMFISTTLALISGDFKGAFEGWKKGWSDMWDGFKQVLKGAWDFMGAYIKTEINTIIGYFNGLLEGINKASGGKVSVGKIPTFRNGGIVPGGINDAVPAILHGGERVVSRTGTDVNGGTTISPSVNINVSGSFMLDSENRVDELARRIVDILSRQNELARYGLSI